MAAAKGEKGCHAVQQSVTELTFEGSGTGASVSKITHNSGSASGHLRAMSSIGGVERVQQNYQTWGYSG